MARWQSTEADTWGYSTNGGEWFYTGYNSHKEAFDAGCGDIDDAHEFTTARCRSISLAFLIDADELECLFEDATVDDELRAAVRRDMTPEEAVSAIAAWVERMGGFGHGRCLESFDEIEHGSDEVSMALIVPGRREYDWTSIRNECVIFARYDTMWLDRDGMDEDSQYGLGLGDMQKHD